MSTTHSPFQPNVNNKSVFPFYGPIYDWGQYYYNHINWDSQKDWAYGRTQPFIVPSGCLPTAQIFDRGGSVLSIVDRVAVHSIYDDPTVPILSLPANAGIWSIENTIDGDKIFVLYLGSGTIDLRTQGPLYITVNIGDLTYYSDVFINAGGEPSGLAYVYDPVELLRLSWWDEHNFQTDDGWIAYVLDNHQPDKAFQHVLWLPTDIGMPDYQFEEEGESRDGYFFPFKQISKKVYRFTFLAPEYLCDSLRLVRMADHIQIDYRNRTYRVTNFSPSFEWQDGGMVAAVTVEFETNTVAKKVGYGKIL